MSHFRSLDDGDVDISVIKGVAGDSSSKTGEGQQSKYRMVDGRRHLYMKSFVVGVLHDRVYLWLDIVFSIIAIVLSANETMEALDLDDDPTPRHTIAKMTFILSIVKILSDGMIVFMAWTKGMFFFILPCVRGMLSAGLALTTLIIMGSEPKWSASAVYAFLTNLYPALHGCGIIIGWFGLVGGAGIAMALFPLYCITKTPSRVALKLGYFLFFNGVFGPTAPTLYYSSASSDSWVDKLPFGHRWQPRFERLGIMRPIPGVAMISDEFPVCQGMFVTWDEMHDLFGF